jgi:hypothetical protein
MDYIQARHGAEQADGVLADSACPPVMHHASIDRNVEVGPFTSLEGMVLTLHFVCGHGFYLSLRSRVWF